MLSCFALLNQAVPNVSLICTYSAMIGEAFKHHIYLCLNDEFFLNLLAMIPLVLLISLIAFTTYNV